MRQILLLGRIFFSLIFIVAGFGHFSQETIDYAMGQGVPYAGLMVPLSGALAIAGGLSILLGFKARIGGWMLALFLIPVTVMMHDFWNIADPAISMLQQQAFFKNLALLGGAFALAYSGSGPYSIDSRWATNGRTPLDRRDGMDLEHRHGVRAGHVTTDSIPGTSIPTSLRRETEAKITDAPLSDTKLNERDATNSRTW